MSVIFLLSLSLILFGLSLIIIFLRNKKHGKETLTWPHVFGKIVKADAEYQLNDDNDKLWKPVIKYAYKVDNKEYNSTRVAFGFIPWLDFSLRLDFGYSRSVKIANKYASQLVTPVFYSPQNPSVSVLEQGVHLENNNLCILGLFFVSVGMLLAFLT